MLQRTECGKGALFTSQLYSRNMRAEIYTELSEDVLEEIDRCVAPWPLTSSLTTQFVTSQFFMHLPTYTASRRCCAVVSPLAP